MRPQILFVPTYSGTCIKQTKDFIYPRNSKIHKKKNLDTRKPRHSKNILPLPLPGVQQTQTADWRVNEVNIVVEYSNRYIPYP